MFTMVASRATISCARAMKARASQRRDSGVRVAGDGSAGVPIADLHNLWVSTHSVWVGTHSDVKFVLGLPRDGSWTAAHVAADRAGRCRGPPAARLRR